MELSCNLSIDQDIVKVNYNEDIKLFNENLIDVTLKTGGYVKKAERDHLVLEVAIFDTESYLLLVNFLDSHPMIGTGEI